MYWSYGVAHYFILPTILVMRKKRHKNVRNGIFVYVTKNDILWSSRKAKRNIVLYSHISFNIFIHLLKFNKLLTIFQRILRVVQRSWICFSQKSNGFR